MTDKEIKEYFCPKCGVKLTLGNCFNSKNGYFCIDCAQKRRVKTVNKLENKQILCTVCSKELAIGDMAIYPTTVICKDCDESFRNTNYYLAHIREKMGNVVDMPKEVSFKNYAATMSLLVLILVLYVISSFPVFTHVNQFFINWGALIPPLLFDGQWWRLITPNFLHFDLNHITANTISIVIWGHLLEKHVGTKAVFLLIFLSCIFTTGFSALMTPDNISLGASGIAYGLMTAFILYVITLTVFNRPGEFKGQMVTFIVFVAIQIVYNYYESSNVDVWGHLGGAVAGLIFIVSYAVVNLSMLSKKLFK